MTTNYGVAGSIPATATKGLGEASLESRSSPTAQLANEGSSLTKQNPARLFLIEFR